MQKKHLTQSYLLTTLSLPKRNLLNVLMLKWRLVTYQKQCETRLWAYAFAEANTDENGYNGAWTKAQVYLAFGNLLHTLARLGIASTPMEGVDADLIGELFSEELDGHVCEVALALGYADEEQDWNHGLPKARLPMEDVITVV